LNEAEQVNIAAAMKWLRRRKRDVLDEAFLRQLHKRLFGKTWRWAGHYRTSARNIGLDLAQAIDDTKFWIANSTFPAHEIAIRFSHRLVFIHPFPNGNGRFSRLVGDLLAMHLGRPPFS
jgi:Fic-DOC domain mobile mystery protein B